MKGIVLYVAAAEHEASALEQADNWLSMFLDWQGTQRQGENYDIDAASVSKTDEIDADTGLPNYEVKVPVEYTEQTSSTLTAYIVEAAA